MKTIDDKDVKQLNGEPGEIDIEPEGTISPPGKFYLLGARKKLSEDEVTAAYLIVYHSGLTDGVVSSRYNPKREQKDEIWIKPPDSMTWQEFLEEIKILVL